MNQRKVGMYQVEGDVAKDIIMVEGMYKDVMIEEEIIITVTQRSKSPRLIFAVTVEHIHMID